MTSQGAPGTIGYVELAYALQSGLNYAAVQNAAGQYVVPNEGSVAADAAAFPNVSATNYLIVNGSGAGSYPISTYSWVIVYQKQSNSNNGIALGKMLDWMATTGQSDAAPSATCRCRRTSRRWPHSTINCDAELRRPTTLQLTPERGAHQVTSLANSSSNGVAPGRSAGATPCSCGPPAHALLRPGGGDHRGHRQPVGAGLGSLRHRLPVVDDVGQDTNQWAPASSSSARSP